MTSFIAKIYIILAQITVRAFHKILPSQVNKAFSLNETWRLQVW